MEFLFSFCKFIIYKIIKSDTYIYNKKTACISRKTTRFLEFISLKACLLNRCVLFSAKIELFESGIRQGTKRKIGVVRAFLISF